MLGLFGLLVPVPILALPGGLTSVPPASGTTPGAQGRQEACAPGMVRLGGSPQAWLQLNPKCEFEKNRRCDP